MRELALNVVFLSTRQTCTIAPFSTLISHDEARKSSSSCRIHEHVLDATDEAKTIQALEKMIADRGRPDFYFASAGVGLYMHVAPLRSDARHVRPWHYN